MVKKGKKLKERSKNCKNMARNTSFTFYSNVNLSPNNDNTLFFADRSAQATFFSSKIITTVSNCYYQRADVNKVQVERAYSTLYRCDYLSFINPDYENKRFYAFVTGVTYINDTTTELTYIIDNIQTWLLDCTIPSCYIERQHSVTDDFGDNMLIDNLDCGEYVTKEIFDNFGTDFVVVFQGTFNIGLWASNFGTKDPPEVQLKNGIYDNASQWAVYSNIGGTEATTDSALSSILNAIYSGLGGVTVDDFINIYMYPKGAIALGTGQDNEYTVAGALSPITALNKIYRVVGAYQSNDRKGQTISVSQTMKVHPTDLDGYTPKNTKTLQFPFAVLHISNNDGSAIDVKYEKFRNPSDNSVVDAQFRLTGCTTGEGKARLTPEQYLGVGETELDYDTAIDSSAFPTVSMVGDPYLIYLAQNKNRLDNTYFQMKLNAVTSIGTTAVNDIGKVVGAYMGATTESGTEGLNTLSQGFNTAVSTYKNIQSLNAELSDRAVAPATASGLSGVGLAFQNGKKLFTATVKTVDRYHAKMIDDFYTMYGYPVKTIETPNLHARTGFTYIKTVGCILKGNAPEEAKAQIEKLFDNGLRFWADYTNFGDYSITNSVITPTP